MISKDGSAQRVGKADRNGRLLRREGSRSGWPVSCPVHLCSCDLSLHFGHQGGTGQGKRNNCKMPRQHVVAQASSPMPLSQEVSAGVRVDGRGKTVSSGLDPGGSPGRVKSLCISPGWIQTAEDPVLSPMPVRCQRSSPGRFVLVSSMRGSPPPVP